MKTILSGKIQLVIVLIIGIFAGMALPVGAVEDTTVNVTVFNTTEVMDPEDHAEGPGTGTGTELSMSAIPEVNVTNTQPVPEATTNVPVTGTESSPSVAPEIPIAGISTQVPVTVTPTSVQVTETPVESLVHETFESSIAESGPGYFSAAEQAMQSERAWGSTVSPASQDVTPLWSNIGGNFSSPPAIADGIVYISSNDDGSFHEGGEFSTYALDLHTGRFKQYLWGTGNGGRGGPTVDNGMVFVGNSNHFVFGYTKGTPGKLITMWRFPTGSSVATRPFVMNGVVYFSDTNKIYALTAGTGKEQWSYDSCGPSCSAPQGANGVVYFSDNDKIYARNAITGDEIWTVSTNDPSIRPHTTSPVVVNGVLYFGSGHNLYAFDATSGHQKWTYNTIGEIYYSPTVANGVVYVGSDPHDFHAVNANSGQKIWTLTTDFAADSSFAVADGVAYFGNGHDLWAVNAADGHKIWNYTAGNSWVGSPAIADGILVVGTDPGPVYAFDLSNTGLSGTPRSGDAPLTVKFTDITAGSPTSWNWQFGDGGSSSLQNPSHVYTAPGNYRVSLVTSGPTGSHTAVRDDYIMVTTPKPPSIDWQKPVGGSKDDLGLMSIRTSDDGVLIVGMTASTDGDIANTGFHGGQDIFAAKYSSNGDLQWKKCYGGSATDQANFVMESNDGGYLIVGSTSSSDGDIIHNNGLDDVWVIRIDLQGNILWQKTYGGSDNEVGTWALQLNDGGYLISGFTESSDGDVIGLHAPENETSDAWLFEIDSSGNLEWQKCYGGSGEDVANVMIPGPNGWIIGGWTTSSDGDVSGGGYHGGEDGWIFSVNTTTHEIVHQRCYGGTKNEEILNMQRASDGGYAASGAARSNNGDISNNHGGDTGTSDIWVLKFDSSDNLTLNKCYGGTLDDGGMSIQEYNNAFRIMGVVYSHDGDVTYNHGGTTGTSDIWLAKIDISGQILWEATYGGSKDDNAQRFGLSMLQPASHGYFVGSTSSNDGDVTGNHGGDSGTSDIWLVKLVSS